MKNEKEIKIIKGFYDQVMRMCSEETPWDEKKYMMTALEAFSNVVGEAIKTLEQAVTE